MQKKSEDDKSQSIFRDNFKEKQNEIEALLDSIELVTDKLELLDGFDKISKGINQLSKYTSSSSVFLIPYDVKMCKNALLALQDRSAELETKLLPRKKFAFKARKGTKSSNVHIDVVDNAAATAPFAIDKSPSDLNAYTLHDETNRLTVLCHDLIKNKDVSLSKLTDCTVFIHGAPNTLHLIALDRCRIVCGPVTTSVFVDNCRDSLFMFPCQQLRVHDTRSSDFHVHVTTRVIIEDTKEVRFGPYRYTYTDIADHFVQSGLPQDRNNWRDVDDFNWLVNNKKSPNWSEIPNDELASSLALLISAANVNE